MVACWNLTKIKHLFLISLKMFLDPGESLQKKTVVFSGSSREIFFTEINAWLPFICFEGFGCLMEELTAHLDEDMQDLLERERERNKLDLWGLVTIWVRIQERFHFKICLRTWKVTGPFEKRVSGPSVHYYLEWVGRHGSCTSAWSFHHLVSFAAIIKVVTQRSSPLVGGGRSIAWRH